MVSLWEDAEISPNPNPDCAGIFRVVASSGISKDVDGLHMELVHGQSSPAVFE